MRIIINYNYRDYPYTTASYFEMAAREIKGIELVHTDNPDLSNIQFILNVMPFDEFFYMPDVPIAYYEIDAHLVQGRKKELYELSDQVYIAQKHYLEYYPKNKTKYLPLACWPPLHHRTKNFDFEYDIGFVGNDTYPERRTLLEQLYGSYHLLWTNTPPGIPYSKTLSKCRMTFNRSMLHDVNMRFFECLSIGRLLLTDYLPEQDEFAERDKHYITYKNWEDLKYIVKYFIDHPDEREKIAKAGSEHIQKYHTYKHRLLNILEDMT
jgi:spore maturation protein CgeB